MNVFALALAGHLVGDWLVQTDWQAMNKSWPQPRSDLDNAEIRVSHGDERLETVRYVDSRRRWRSWGANQAHMLTYHLALAAFVGWAWHDGWALGALAVSWVTHSIIDRRWPVKALLGHTGSSAFSEQTWGVLAADQALHLAILALLTAART